MAFDNVGVPDLIQQKINELESSHSLDRRIEVEAISKAWALHFGRDTVEWSDFHRANQYLYPPADEDRIRHIEEFLEQTTSFKRLANQD